MLHIIYTRDGVWLSKQAYATWQQVQADYPAYMASLGPWPQAQVADYLDDEYPSLQPAAAQQIARLLAAADVAVELSFAAEPDQRSDGGQR